MLISSKAPDTAFREYLHNGEIRIQLCTDCRRFFFYPRVLCPHCGSCEYRWEKISGRGTIYSFTIERASPGQGEDRNLVLVDLEEGPRLISRVADTEPDKLHIGQPVTAFIGAMDGEPLLLFNATG